MQWLIFLVLLNYAVKCDNSNSNYYVIEMPVEDEIRLKKPFQVYWNVPTMQCKSKKIPFEGLYEKYGIIQNTGDSFRGDKVVILYDPGMFPALLKNETSGKYKFRNGGVPQEGNLDKHLDAFRKVIEQSIPDKDFDGIGIIDFESWRPTFRQNFGVLVPYKDISIEIERERHKWWPRSWIEEEARRRFEEAGRVYMQNTISVAKQMRPKGLWGYYGLPYCFESGAKCSEKVPKENDNLYWLWGESTALYPSVYVSASLSSQEQVNRIIARVSEAARVRRSKPILPYFWYRYRDDGFLSEKDLTLALKTLYKSEATGFIIWGSSSDVNTAEKCTNLLNYLENTLGPMIAKYTKANLKENDEIDATTTEKDDVNKNRVSFIDPESIWDPPINYTQDIKKYVEDELKDGELNDETNDSEKVRENALVQAILNVLFNNNTVSNTEEKYSKEIEINKDEKKKSNNQVDIDKLSTLAEDLDKEKVKNDVTTVRNEITESNIYDDSATTTDAYDSSTQVMVADIFFNEDTLFDGDYTTFEPELSTTDVNETSENSTSTLDIKTVTESIINFVLNDTMYVDDNNNKNDPDNDLIESSKNESNRSLNENQKSRLSSNNSSEQVPVKEYI